MIFRHTVTLYPVTISESSLGGMNQSFAANGTTYASFVQVRNESLAIINESGGVRTGVVCYVLGDCPAKPLDRITYANKTYEVTGSMPQRSPDSIHHTKIMMIELDNIE
jgi:hypothetical protein